MTIVQIKIAVWIGFEAFNNGISGHLQKRVD